MKLVEIKFRTKTIFINLNYSTEKKITVFYSSKRIISSSNGKVEESSLFNVKSIKKKID